MSDNDLALAIALSLAQLEEEKQSQTPDLPLPTIYELHHCNKSIFSKTPLDRCSICNTSIPSTSLESISHVHDSHVSACKPRSICIRPTLGSFTRYTERMLLHCGISNSTGTVVYNFDERGCNDDSSTRWSSCLSITIPSSLTDDDWNKALRTHNQSETTFKKFKSYHQMNNNCYDYVIRFLNSIQFEGSDGHKKEDIVLRFIQKPIELFESYFTLFKKLQNNKVVVLDSMPKSTGPTRHTCDGCSDLVEMNAKRYRCFTCPDFDFCEKCFKKGTEIEKHMKTHKMFETIEHPATYNCDVCSSKISTSYRYHCTDKECSDYDLCETCWKKGSIASGNNTHKKHHSILKL